MPLLQLLVLAIVAMVCLATLRLVRVHFGRSPLPDGRGRRFFLLGFVVVPPLVLGALTQSAPTTSKLGAIPSLPAYIGIVGALVFLMWIAALIIGLVTSGRSGQLARLALAGSQNDPYDDQIDPPVTATLAASVVVVNRFNAMFPRGREFPRQVARTGFQEDWDALDGATRTLEGGIADDHRLGLVVASSATATATDARSRLDTLRRLAGDHGQAWAAM
jgi:hypothetical protein